MPALRFGAFELDLEHDELRRNGVLIKLAPQQYRVLRYLAGRPGEIATRDEIRQEIWGGEVFVDFDRSLNVCVAQIRAALNDDPEAARFIQTVPRKGYRFVAPVNTPPAPMRRNFAKPIAAALGLAAIASVAWISTSKAPAPRTVLAVMPFENLTEQSQFVPVISGVADELITQFGTALPERLAVIGRTSVARLVAQKAGVAQIGRDVGATYVLEGDWRGEGSRVRITARLIQVAEQTQFWSDTYELDNAGPLEMEEDVAARVTAGVIGALFPQAPRHMPSHDAYPVAREAEADIGKALSGAAPPEAAMEQARSAARRALEIDETNPIAHNALADVLLWRDWKFPEAERHFARAIALNPSYAQAHHDYAFCLIVTGRSAAGVAEMRRGIAIDPLSPRVNVDAGWLLLQAHRFDQAIAAARRALELEPGMLEAKACIARAEFLRNEANPEDVEFYRTRASSSNPYERALALAVLKRRKEAISALHESLARRQISLVMAATEPVFSTLQSEPGYREIVAKVFGTAARDTEK